MIDPVTGKTPPSSPGTSALPDYEQLRKDATQSFLSNGGTQGQVDSYFNNPLGTPSYGTLANDAASWYSDPARSGTALGSPEQRQQNIATYFGVPNQNFSFAPLAGSSPSPASASPMGLGSTPPNQGLAQNISSRLGGPDFSFGPGETPPTQALPQDPQGQAQRISSDFGREGLSGPQPVSDQTRLGLGGAPPTPGQAAPSQVSPQLMQKLQTLGPQQIAQLMELLRNLSGKQVGAPNQDRGSLLGGSP